MRLAVADFEEGAPPAPRSPRRVLAYHLIWRRRPGFPLSVVHVAQKRRGSWMTMPLMQVKTLSSDDGRVCQSSEWLPVAGLRHRRKANRVPWWCVMLRFSALVWAAGGLALAIGISPIPSAADVSREE